jgi:hypothetical protein
MRVEPAFPPLVHQKMLVSHQFFQIVLRTTCAGNYDRVQVAQFDASFQHDFRPPQFLHRIGVADPMGAQGHAGNDAFRAADHIHQDLVYLCFQLLKFLLTEGDHKSRILVALNFYSNCFELKRQTGYLFGKIALLLQSLGLFFSFVPA